MRKVRYNAEAQMAVDISHYSDRREIPRYNLVNVAWYLAIKESTLRSWVRGRNYQTKHGKKWFKPLIEPALSLGTAQDPMLSFFNLAEVHVLSAIRKWHKLNFKKIRTAIDFIQKHFPAASKHPLIAESFYTDGVDLFVKALLGSKEKHTVNISRGGQLALKSMLDLYLQRIDRGADGMPIRVFPIVSEGTQRKIIVMTPEVSSGQPVINGKGIRAMVIWNRNRAGESVKDLARDYGLGKTEVQAAIEYVNSIEHNARAA